MTSPSTTAAGPSQMAQSASAPALRVTSPAKSRLTVRLPDLSSARIPSVSIAAPAASPNKASPDPTSSIEMEGRSESNAGRQDELASRVKELPRKALELVRQPKFWLACVVAIAVQIVLAFVMTPADAGPEREKRSAASAKPAPKRAEEPAACIVVPAAPANLNDERSDAMSSGASPMGPASPQESSDDAGVQDSASFSDSGGAGLSATLRMAENRPLTDDSGHFTGQLTGQRQNEADGATLGGIAPLEPGLPAQDRGPR